MIKKLYFYIPSKLKSLLNQLTNYIAPSLVDDFVYSDIGKQYGLTIKSKIFILKRLNESLKKVNSATNLNVHLTLLSEILKLPLKKNPSAIVECGTFEVSTSIVLSIAAEITNRKLIIYDSFSGLPNSEKKLGERLYPHLNFTGFYKKSMYACSLKKVQNNIKLFGEIGVCSFRKGFFKNTLPKHTEKIDFLFLDVDLCSSTKECIKYLWKHLNNNRFVFTDDACDMNVVKIWFDEKWWKKNLHSPAPGYIGSGCGIITQVKYSSLGYSYKNISKKKFTVPKWLNKE